MYTRPGQQGDDDLRRDLAREPTCECGHIIWLHRFMDLNDRSCSHPECPCTKLKRQS